MLSSKIFSGSKNLVPGLMLTPLVIGSCSSDKKDKGITSQEHPNIVCIVAEDISPYLGCYGDPVARTPNLDKLASEGVRFTNVFAPMGVCAPARAALITGLYPTSFGANNMRTGAKYMADGVAKQDSFPPYEAVPPTEVKCYTEFMRAAGYYCTNNPKEDYQFDKPITAWDESSTKAHYRNRPDKDMPFFAIFNIMRSHESQVNAWRDEPLIIHPDSVIVPPYYPDNDTVRIDIARMHSNNTIMDRQVQEIIDQLKEDGLLEKTIIIFYADHGGPLPRGKREIYDSGLEVPFIVRFPGKKNAGTVVDDLVSFVDVPPTILSLAGIEIPDYMQGQAFLGNQKAAPREYIHAARDRVDENVDMRRAVRSKDFKYIKNFYPDTGCYQDVDFRKQLALMQSLLAERDKGTLNEDQMYWFRKKKQPEELYNIHDDPHELNNIVNDPAHEEVLEEMRVEMNRWLTEIDDKGVKYQKEKDLVWSMWPNGIQPVTEAPKINLDGSTATLTCGTEGASIAYQVNGKGYNEEHWFLYTGPVKLENGDTITAKAIRIGYKESESSSRVMEIGE